MDELVGPVDLPVYASAAGGPGHLIVTTEIVQFVRRPHPLVGVTYGYGLLITGESMIPAFWPGDIALVHPNLHPSAGCDVVLYQTLEHGEREAVIKHLIRATDEEWVLRQWNPPDGEARDYRLHRADWPVAHVAVGRYKGR